MVEEKKKAGIRKIEENNQKEKRKLKEKIGMDDNAYK